jgi:signal transduction histidine kinase/ligand-binding sensor domain-containing protein
VNHGILKAVTLGVLLLLACAPNSFGLAGTDGFFVRNWKAEDGLPENTVCAVVQTRDGYLWLGCYDGLLRFDGVKFTLFNNDNVAEMRDNAVTSLYEGRDGALWIGHENGELTRFSNGCFSAVHIPSGTVLTKIKGMAVDEGGDVWALDDRGTLVRAGDGRVLSPPASDTSGTASFIQSTNGLLWTLIQGRLSELRGGRLYPVHQEGQAPLDNVQSAAPSMDGGVWIVRNSRLVKWRNQAITEDWGPVPWESGFVSALVEHRDGWLVAGVVEKGLYIFRPDAMKETVHLSHTNGLSGDWILSMVSDHEGNIWAGTGGAGLMVIREKQVELSVPPDGWQNRSVLTTTFSHDGTLWVGTEGAGLYRLNHGVWTNYSYAQQLHAYVWSVVEDASSNIWVGTWGVGLFVLRSNIFDKVLDSEQRWPNVTALCCSSAGGLWAGTESGLVRFTGTNATVYDTVNGQPLRRVRSLAEDRDGGVWFGMLGGGLGYMKNGVFRLYRRADGLASDFVSALHLDSDGVLWIGTAGSGLCRFKEGRFGVVSTAQGLANAHICHIEEDDLGYLWMSSHGGLMRISKEQVDLCLAGRSREVSCLAYGLAEGLPTVTCSGSSTPSGCRLPDGRLCFATIKGLVTVDPRQVRMDAAPLPVLIERMRVDDRVVAEGDALKMGINIAPGWHRVEFDYTGLSFVTAERMHFKYRVDNLDNDWVDAGKKRAATYSRVPPGDYVFRVIACNRNGVWSRESAAVVFTVKPLFWQTWWFQLSCLAAVVGLCSAAVWYAGRRRMHRALELSERRRAVESERARIARDIHDDLGARLTRISMLSESVTGWREDAEKTRVGMIRIRDTTRELIRSLDEIVWAVNPQRDSLEGLANYLEKYALSYLEASRIRCRLDLPIRFPKWPLTSEVRHNIFLAFKEALNNLVKHAAATEADIAMRLREDGFDLEITDNGRGFRPDSLDRASDRPGGNGLQNMRARLTNAGGICRIISSPGEGTHVVFEVKLGGYEA